MCSLCIRTIIYVNIKQNKHLSTYLSKCFELMKILGLDGLESLRVNFRTTKCTIMNRAMFSFMECIYLFFLAGTCDIEKA